MQTDVIPMTSQLREALTEHRKASIRSMYVFSGADGERYTKRQKIMPALCRRAGVVPFGFHAIRHLSASILAKAGLPLPTIQAILRHKSATTTARYLHSLGIVQNVLDGVFEGELHKTPTHAKVVHIK
jgi:integrase